MPINTNLSGVPGLNKGIFNAPSYQAHTPESYASAGPGAVNIGGKTPAQRQAEYYAAVEQGSPATSFLTRQGTFQSPSERQDEYYQAVIGESPAVAGTRSTANALRSGGNASGGFVGSGAEGAGSGGFVGNSGSGAGTNAGTNAVTNAATNTGTNATTMTPMSKGELVGQVPAYTPPAPGAGLTGNDRLYFDAYGVAPGASGVRTGNVAFGEEGWINPGYHPGRNDQGYTRFNARDQFGSGVERAFDQRHGAEIFDAYYARPEWRSHDQGQLALSTLAQLGVTPETASDWDKFQAADAAFRGGQLRNQRPKRTFGVGDALGLVGNVVGMFGAPVGATYNAIQAGRGGHRLNRALSSPENIGSISGPASRASTGNANVSRTGVMGKYQ